MVRIILASQDNRHVINDLRAAVPRLLRAAIPQTVRVESLSVLTVGGLL